MAETGAAIVPFAPHHTAQILNVIGAVFGEYGATFEPSGFDADLTDIPNRYLATGGTFSVLEEATRVVGTVAATPYYGATCELKRLYLLPEYRGRGYGRALLEHALEWAETAGYLAALAWSDSRFTIAHGVYARLGFTRIGERMLNDTDRSREYGFRRRLRPRVLAGTTPCVLCGIATGEVKSDRIVQTPRIVGFVNDIEPRSRGHSVFFPRRHTPTLHEADDEDLAEIMAAVKRVAQAMELEQYNTLQNTGALAGQTVFHVHIHLIPKWTATDGLVIERPAVEYIDQRDLSHRLRDRLRCAN